MIQCRWCDYQYRDDQAYDLAVHVQALHLQEFQDAVSRPAGPMKPQPRPSAAVDWTQVFTIALHHIEGLAGRHEDCHEDDNCKHYVYEAAVQAIYGEAIWPWLNNRGSCP